MTEIERLKADLATLHAANNVQGTGRGFNQLVRAEIVRVADKIEELEAQQAPEDEWADSRMFVQEILADSSFPQRLIWLARYARHLEVNVADLDNELRCERIDGGKVRDDRKAINAEKNREKLAELVTILNAIPPACELARELVEKRIEGVKKEMHRPEEQGNG